MNDTEDFPFPQALSRESFDTGSEDFDADVFLYNHHRFSTLDDLHQELTDLLKQLDAELLCLVNNDYNDFISLGHSIDGGLELIGNIEIDLHGYANQLQAEQAKLTAAAEAVTAEVEFQRGAFRLKYQAQLVLCLDQQLTHFEAGFEAFEPKKMLTMHLVIQKLHALVSGFTNRYAVEVLGPRVSGLRIEFRAVLDEWMERERVKGGESVVMVDLLAAFVAVGGVAKPRRGTSHAA